jgi:hypothetical protein
MRNYIVRIYRDGGERTDDLMGIVEAVGGRRKWAFKNCDELWAILRRPRPRGRARQRNLRTTTESGS